jgi:periplasmic divalent cation tolerance protein
MTQFCLVLVSCKSQSEARKIGQALVKQKLAACVNIIPKVNSLFFWNKKISREREALLLIKTRRQLFSALSEAIKKSHSYKLPEIIALPVWTGEKGYLNWLKKETRQK